MGRARRTGAQKPRDVQAQWKDKSSVEEQLRAELAEVKAQLAQLTNSKVTKGTDQAKQNSQKPRNSKSQGSCHYCGKKGHFVAKCYKKQRDEASRTQSGVSQSNNNTSGVEQANSRN